MKFREILLIDDDEDDQEIFNLALDQVSPNLNCQSINDASLALQKLEDQEIIPDVIFLDLNMPIMNGQQFLKEIKQRKQLKHIPVIIFSTSYHQATIDLTKEMGARDFVTKPGTVDELVKILKPILL